METDKNTRVSIFTNKQWLNLDCLFGVLPIFRISVRCAHPECRAIRLDDYSWKFISPADIECIAKKPAVHCPEHAATPKTDS